MKVLKAIALVAAGALSMLGALMILARNYEELSQFQGDRGGWNLD